MKLKILFLLSLLSFEGFSAPLKPDLLNDLTKHLENVYPETVRNLDYLRQGSEFAHCPVSLYNQLIFCGNSNILSQFDPNSKNPALIDYIQNVATNYLAKVETEYRADLDETCISVIDSIKEEIAKTRDLVTTGFPLEEPGKISKAYGILARVLYLANDLSIRRHGQSKTTDIQANLKRLLLRESGVSFPYGGSEAWKKTAEETVFAMISEYSALIKKFANEGGGSFIYSQHGYLLQKNIGLSCPTIYCPGALKLGLTTLVLAALQENPVALVALPVGEKSLTRSQLAHSIFMSPLDFVAHDYFHAAVTRNHLKGIYRWAEQKARGLIHSRS